MSEMVAVAAQDPGSRPELLWLPVEKLAVDHRYQRTIESRRSQKLVEDIAANFRWSAFQAILATAQKNLAGGVIGWLVIDGQHRVEAARKVGILEVPAVVVDAGSLAEQAAAFVRANTDRVAVNPFALFHARRQAGDQEAEAIYTLCRDAGVSIPHAPLPLDRIKPGQTLALGTIARLPKLHGIDVARAAMKSVAAAYGSTPGGIRAPLLAASARVIADGGNAADLVEVLKQRDPGDLELRAMTRKRHVGGTQASALAAILSEAVKVKRQMREAQGGESFIKPPSREQMMGGR